eukprot:1382404-Pyramimonas_sp.AAC.2
MVPAGLRTRHHRFLYNTVLWFRTVDINTTPDPNYGIYSTYGDRSDIRPHPGKYNGLGTYGIYGTYGQGPNSGAYYGHIPRTRRLRGWSYEYGCDDEKWWRHGDVERI